MSTQYAAEQSLVSWCRWEVLRGQRSTGVGWRFQIHKFFSRKRKPTDEFVRYVTSKQQRKTPKNIMLCIICHSTHYVCFFSCILTSTSTLPTWSKEWNRDGSAGQIQLGRQLHWRNNAKNTIGRKSKSCSPVPCSVKFAQQHQPPFNMQAVGIAQNRTASNDSKTWSYCDVRPQCRIIIAY